MSLLLRVEQKVLKRRLKKRNEKNLQTLQKFRGEHAAEQKESTADDSIETSFPSLKGAETAASQHQTKDKPKKQKRKLEDTDDKAKKDAAEQKESTADDSIETSFPSLKGAETAASQHQTEDKPKKQKRKLEDTDDKAKKGKKKKKSAKVSVKRNLQNDDEGNLQNDDRIENERDQKNDDEVQREEMENEHVNNEEDKSDSESQLPGSRVGAKIMTDKTFQSLSDEVSELTLKGIADMGFTHMTMVQAKVIPHLLEGRDLIGAAQTGSGKTLAYLIPAINLLYKLKFMARNGTGVIIITPTRELAMQVFGVLNELLQHHTQTFGLVMGGTNKKAEAIKLNQGINFLVSTPGRLLDHLQNTRNFLYKNLQCLIIDEADRILDVGFEEEMKQIINLLPKRRQTMLFSATKTEKTEALAKLALKKEPIYIGVDDANRMATVQGLQQGYVVVPSEKRFLLLFTLLKKNRKKKVMVFFSSCNSVKYHNELLNYIDVPVMAIHGKQKQTKRTPTFYQFCNADSGILLCTDVAARGLDIPDVDWIVQYDPPDDPKEYIHRVGRTARGEGGQGNALLFLTPDELGFLRYLKEAKVPLNEFEFSWSKIADINAQLEQLISKNYFLHMSAKAAYKTYVRAYMSHSLKHIYNINKLDLKKVAKTFGFSVPPYVNLDVYSSRYDHPRKKMQKRFH